MKHGNGACTQAKVLYAICMFLLHLHIEDMLPREHRIPDTQIHRYTVLHCPARLKSTNNSMLSKQRH